MKEKWKEMPQLFDEANNDSMESIMFLRCVDISSWNFYVSKRKTKDFNWNVKQIHSESFVDILNFAMGKIRKINRADFVVSLTGKSLPFELCVCYLEETFDLFSVFGVTFKDQSIKWDWWCWVLPLIENIEIRHDHPVSVANDIFIFPHFIGICNAFMRWFDLCHLPYVLRWLRKYVANLSPFYAWFQQQIKFIDYNIWLKSTPVWQSHCFELFKFRANENRAEGSSPVTNLFDFLTKVRQRFVYFTLKSIESTILKCEYSD